MGHHVLFTPYITVKVEDGEVTGVQIDWSDTLQNVYTADGEEVWESGQGDQPEAADTACDFIDNEKRRKRILDSFTEALKGGGADGLDAH